MTTFESIGVRPRTSAALNQNGFTEPNTVQQEAIPPLLARHDCVIEAPTGSGKTLAYVVPMVERLAGHQGHGARALVVTPTRELATQVNAVIRKVDPALRTVICIGGVGYGPQTGGLRNAPDVIVGCPGRLLDLASNGLARLRDIEYLVLDEADEMLDQGFAKDVERIISMCPNFSSSARRQTVLASATMPDWVQSMITKHLYEPARVRVVNEQVPALEHGVMSVVKSQKIDALSRLLRRQRASELNQTIVFHRTKHGAKKLVRDLLRMGHTAGGAPGQSLPECSRSCAGFVPSESDRGAGRHQRRGPRHRRRERGTGHQLRAPRDTAMAHASGRPHRAQRQRGQGDHLPQRGGRRTVAQAPPSRRPGTAGDRWNAAAHHR